MSVEIRAKAGRTRATDSTSVKPGNDSEGVEKASDTTTAAVNDVPVPSFSFVADQYEKLLHDVFVIWRPRGNMYPALH